MKVIPFVYLYLYPYMGMNMRFMFMYVICVDVNVKSKGNLLLFIIISIFLRLSIIRAVIGKIIWHLSRLLGVPVPFCLVYCKYEIELKLRELSNRIVGDRSIPVLCRHLEVSILRPTPIYHSFCNNIKLNMTMCCISVYSNPTNIIQVTYISRRFHLIAPINKHENSSLNYG